MTVDIRSVVAVTEGTHHSEGVVSEPAHIGSERASVHRSPLQGRLLAAVFAGTLALTGCTIGDSGSAGEQAAEAPAEPAAVIDVSVADGANDANPAEPVVLTAENGQLDSVVMRNPEGVPVQGEFNAEHTEWRTTEELGYGRQYTLESTATDEEGLVTRSNTTFSTITPDIMTAAYLTVGEGEVVGIGQPVAVMFDEPIADRHAAQENIHITTTPEVEGAFYWVSGGECAVRPSTGGPVPRSTFMDIYGEDLGGGMYGGDNQASFEIGDDSLVDVRTSRCRRPQRGWSRPCLDGPHRPDPQRHLCHR